MFVPYSVECICNVDLQDLFQDRFSPKYCILLIKVFHCEVSSAQILFLCDQHISLRCIRAELDARTRFNTPIGAFFFFICNSQMIQ